jgi:DNA polymerase-1
LIGDLLRVATYYEGKIRIEAPELGKFVGSDLEDGQLHGLDCETSTFNSFSDSFQLRTVQIATSDVAWVFRMDDPDQREYCREFLSNDVNSFASYTDADVLFVWRGLDVDISHRNVDCRTLGTMASPDDRMGGLGLKDVTKKYLKVNWLDAAQGALEHEMVELYKRDHPTVVRPTKKMVASYGWANIPVDNPIYTKYGGLDAVAARRLVPVLIKKSGAPFSLLRMETWLDAESARLRMRGMVVDQEAYNTLYDSAKAACDYHEQEFGDLVFEMVRRGRKPNYEWFEKPISPRSGKKVAKYLHDMGADFSGFPLTDKGIQMLADGLLTTEDEVKGTYASLKGSNKDLVKRLNVTPEAERAVEHLFAFKEKVYTTTKCEEIQKVIDSENKIHPVLRTCGTVTGRMSSSAPNVQNWPKKDSSLREMIVPEPGYVFIGCDFPSIEIRVGAGLSQCPVLGEILAEGRDIHQETADATGTDRQTAKITNFLCQYNGGPKALNAQTGIEIHRAKEIVQAYWAKYWGMDKYRRYTGKFQPEIRTISNRRIPVPYNYKKSEYMGYKSINYFIQSAARELMVSAWWRFVNTPGTEGMNVVAVIHDEMVVSVKEEDLAFGLTALENAMSLQFMGVTVKSDALLLADAQGRSFWTTGDSAEKYREERAKNGTLVQGLY